MPPTLVGGEERKEGSKGGYSLGRSDGHRSETLFYILTKLTIIVKLHKSTAVRTAKLFFRKEKGQGGVRMNFP